MPSVIHTIVSGYAQYEIVEPGDDSIPVIIPNADVPSESVEIVRRALPRLVQLLARIAEPRTVDRPNGYPMN